MNEEILAFPTELLSKEPIGFFDNYINRLLRYSSFYERSFLEDPINKENVNTTFKQIIPYACITCGDSILIYERNDSETRLHGKKSIGFGGHINRTDGKDILSALSREITEELIIGDDCKLVSKYIGFININSSKVNSVHFGLCHNIISESLNIKPRKETEINFSWIKINEIDKSELEDWSRILYENLI